MIPEVFLDNDPHDGQALGTMAAGVPDTKHVVYSTVSHKTHTYSPRTGHLS